MTPTIDMTKAQAAFAAGVNYAARLTGFSPKKIVKAEAGSILKAAAAETDVADVAKVTKGARLRALRALGMTGAKAGAPVTVDAGIRGPLGRVFIAKKGGSGAGYRRTHDADFAPLNQHYPDAVWNDLKAAVAAADNKTTSAAQRAPESVALARGSWVRIADHAGIDLADVPGGRISASALAKARAAKAFRGAEVNNGTSVTLDEKGKFGLTMINRYPGGSSPKLQFGRLLAFKVAGRAKFLAMACKKGFDGSLEQTTKLFKGWTLKKGAS